MWHRTVKIKIKKYKVDCIIYLSTDDNGDDIICFQSMLNEYFLMFDMFIGNRDLAHSLIEHFPIKTIQFKMTELAYESGAIG